MEDIKVRLCRLCLTAIDGENYEAIDTAGVLLLKLDYDSRKNIMCDICSPRLTAALKFKSTCLDTDDSIISYVSDTTALPMDLKEVYRKERECKYVSDDVKVCRLCMQPINNISEVISFNDEHAEMIQKFIPDMHLFIVDEPVMCKLCEDSLALHYNFLNNCWDLEQSGGTNCNGHIPDAPSPIPSLDASVKTEVDIDFESVEELNQIDYMDVNYGENKIESDIQGQEMCSQLAETQCSSKDNFTTNQKSMELYKCQNCNYRASHKWLIQRHALIHKDPSEVQLYKCEVCNYGTKYNAHLKSHKLIMHKDSSEVHMYKCDKCDFATKYKGYLKTHTLRHEDSLQVQVYKCEICSYKTKNKVCLEQHMIIHKDPSEVQINKCATCNFETKHKRALTNHMLIHKNPSEVQMYKCEVCNFVTKHRSNLKKHMIRHKDRSEVQMYKCQNCNYKSKFKSQLKRHMLIYKDPSEVQMYRCETCNYETKFKAHLKQHMFIHKDRSEVQMYRCETCNYETKYKGHLNKHILRCKGSPEVHL